MAFRPRKPKSQNLPPKRKVEITSTHYKKLQRIREEKFLEIISKEQKVNRSSPSGRVARWLSGWDYFSRPKYHFLKASALHLLLRIFKFSRLGPICYCALSLSFLLLVNCSGCVAFSSVADVVSWLDILFLFIVDSVCDRDFYKWLAILIKW